MNQDSHFFFELASQMPGFVLVMDKQSKFIYSNQYTAKLLGYTKVDKMLGDTARDIHCQASSCADEFFQQDLYVINHEVRLTLLDIHAYANNEKKIFIANKVPFYIKGKLSGTICHCTDIQPELISRLSSCLVHSDQKYFNEKWERTYTVGDTLGENTLTKRELDCLFYIIRGKTMKEIGKILNISWRTIESYSQRIKLKWGLDSRSQIIDYAINHGYLTYVPKEIFSRDVSCVIEKML